MRVLGSSLSLIGELLESSARHAAAGTQAGHSHSSIGELLERCVDEDFEISIQELEGLTLRPMIDNDTMLQLLSFVVALAAINWAVVAFFDYNLLVDLLGFAEGTTNYKVTVALIGVAASLKIYDTVLWAAET